MKLAAEGSLAHNSVRFCCRRHEYSRDGKMEDSARAETILGLVRASDALRFTGAEERTILGILAGLARWRKDRSCGDKPARKACKDSQDGSLLCASEAQ